jgi:lipopolysaccharide/colanic/teichoic acid biosynthesis glycosyltransferase
VPFLLVLLNLGELRIVNGGRDQLAHGIMNALSSVTRETDLVGWYKADSVVGVLFTDLGDAAPSESVVNPILAKVVEALNSQLGLAKACQIAVSWHIFPEGRVDDSNSPDDQCFANPTLYPDLVKLDVKRRMFRIIKRTIDVLGSTTALLLLSPVFGVIAILVKLSSKGPVIFKQERLGEFGNTFTVYKFRSMYEQSDCKIHQEFMKRVISGEYHADGTDGDQPVYKMTNDPRITPLGRFLRRTSLDELPQFVNVLMGEMSLVGPRPPLAYEYRHYSLWQRRRIMEVKPGITGLWQVKGRSRVRFDEMVRLDLRYGRCPSILLDLEILAETPRAVMLAHDAF